MSSPIQIGLPAPGTLKVSMRLIVVVVAVGMVAQAIGGATASIAMGLSAGSAMMFGTFMSTRAAVVVTFVLGAAAALGAAAYGQPWLSGAAVAVMVLVTAPATTYSAGILMLAPLLTMLFAVTDRGWPWWLAGLWGLVGGLVGLAIAALMKFGKAPPSPLAWGLAWRHAVVLAVAVGASIVIAELLATEHAYWVAVTLLVALRPVPGERMAYAIQRIWGTLAGSVIALITVWLVPSGGLMIAAFVYLVALAAYAMSGNYFMQTLFLTPMLMIFLTSGADKETTVELTVGRVYYTIIGVLLAAALAYLMAVWDRRADRSHHPTPNASGPQPNAGGGATTAGGPENGTRQDGGRGE